MSDNLILLVMAGARRAINPDQSLEERLRASMGACKNHFMVNDEDTQFKAAVAAVHELSTDEDERRRIRVELNGLAALSALLSGVPVDVSQVETNDEPIGLSKIWREVVGA